MFAEIHMVLELRSFKVCMKTSLVGEYGTANSISISSFSQMLHLRTRSIVLTILYVHMYVHMCIHMCMCVCVCVCVKPEEQPAT